MIAARHPVDSADAAELREVEAEQQRQELEAAIHDPRCRGGWLGEDLDGRLIACLLCRPHLVDRACMTCSAKASSCEQRRLVDGRRCCPDCRHGRRTS